MIFLNQIKKQIFFYPKINIVGKIYKRKFTMTDKQKEYLYKTGKTILPDSYEEKIPIRSTRDASDSVVNAYSKVKLGSPEYMGTVYTDNFGAEISKEFMSMYRAFLAENLAACGGTSVKEVGSIEKTIQRYNYANVSLYNNETGYLESDENSPGERKDMDSVLKAMIFGNRETREKIYRSVFDHYYKKSMKKEAVMVK